MARCGSGYLNRRIADRGNDGGASDLFDHEVEQPQRLAWLTPGLGAVDRVERLQHLVPGLGLVLSSALEETKLVEPVWDESTRDEEYLTNGDFIYDSQPVYDEYADEEWYSLFIRGDRNLSGRKLVEGGARLGGDGIGVATVGDLPNLKVPMFQPPTTESLNFEPQANNLRMSNSNGSMMNTVGKVKLFMEVMMIIMKGNHVDVPFDPGGSFLRHIKTRGRVFFEGEENDADRHGPAMLMRGYAFSFQKFLDSSKLKRHFLIHTGERDFICPHEGCGKAFSLDFNLKSHMKTHSQENYHICPFRECGKRYAHEYKLKKHMMSHHEKNNMAELPSKYLNIQVQPVEKPPPRPPKMASTATYATASYDRPYACPYDSCDKAYIHEYKLNLHLRREHPGHLPEENPKNTSRNKNNNNGDMDAGSDHDVYAVKRGNTNSQKQNRPKPNIRLPPAKVAKHKPAPASVAIPSVAKKQLYAVAKPVHEDEDSEETEEDRDDDPEDGWRYRGNDNDDDDEETDYED